MRKQAFERRKNTLAILLVFFVIISMMATAVSATDEIKHHHSGAQHKSGKNSSEQHQGGYFQVRARPVGATPGLITDDTYGLSAPATPVLYPMSHMDSRAQLIKHIAFDK